MAEIHLVSDDGTRILAQAEGDGDPLVVVHGTNGGLDSWNAVAERLPGRRIWRYARRGYPPSGERPSVNTFAAEAQDLLTVARAARDRDGCQVNVVGGSLGAVVALHAVVADTGSEIGTLALFEPPLLQSGPRLAPVLDAYRALLSADRPADALTLLLADVARLPRDLLDAAPLREMTAAVARSAAVSALGDIEAMAADSTDVLRWAAIEVPVLLMGGGESWQPLPDALDALEAVLPRVRRVTFDGHAHFATQSAPDQVASALQIFLDER